MRIVLLGAPGSGKGTQAKQLVDHYGVVQISTGDLLRAAVASGSELGKAAKTAMDAGQLVSDDIVLGMIKERLSQPDTQRGYILDGFPRNLAQAAALDALLDGMNQSLQAAISLEVPFDDLMHRLTGRQTCSSCGAIFNRYTHPSAVPDVCDACGGTLVQRADDNEATVSHRLTVFEAQTAPLIAYYENQGKLAQIDGTRPISEITEQFHDVLAGLNG
ncbi:MAG: adenylate kinase [Halothiobacillus sp. 20-53-49]|nr:adenylate kinase [Halothiobacillaceae bacterium]OYV45650.1 MAG: adenylate kinase [Halothiobacillus sp. 20-53-49]HUN00532.1 adenylate kinase [Halothiobacillus sp.]